MSILKLIHPIKAQEVLPDRSLCGSLSVIASDKMEQMVEISQRVMVQSNISATNI